MKWGRPAEEMIVPQAHRTLKFALGENPKQANRPAAAGEQRYPASRMGVNAIIRRELAAARNYMTQSDRYNEIIKSRNPPRNLVPPRRDLRMDALADLLRGRLVARVHSYRADESLEFMNLAKEFGFKIACFEHIPEAFKITGELARAGIGTSVFLDSWAYKMEASEGIAYGVAYCTQQGILVSLNSDGAERIRRLFNDAAKAVKYGGLSEIEALRLITINPAIQLGVDEIAGSLEPGKHGDVAIFNEHPLSAYTRCEMTIIEGDIYVDREQYLKDRAAAKKSGGVKTAGGGQ
jgi:imidazolonepropionase-like amidohydrolase